MDSNGVVSLAETLAARRSIGTKPPSSDSASATPPEVHLTPVQEQIRQARQFQLFGRAGLPERAVKTLWDHGYRPGAWDQARAAMIECYRTGGMTLLFGKRKTGKTVLAAAVAVNLIACGRAVVYVRGLGLLQDLRKNHNENSTETRELVRPYYRWPLLIVDEVGVRVRGDEYSDSDAALLTDLIDHRYAAMTTTFLISNESEKDTLAILGPSITRRIAETGAMIEANWGPMP
jgi:DNA replication protein DnaC